MAFYILIIYMSGKSKITTPPSDNRSDSELEKDMQQVFAASKKEKLTPFTTNTDLSEAGPSNLEQTATSTSTEPAVFGPPTLGDLVDQVFTAFRKQRRNPRRLWHTTVTDMQGKKIVKRDTNAIPYTLQQFIIHYGEREGLEQWQRALAYTTNRPLQQALRQWANDYETDRQRGLLPEPIQQQQPLSIGILRTRVRRISQAYTERIINFLNFILIGPRRSPIFSLGTAYSGRVLIDFLTDYILDMPEVDGRSQDGHIHLTNNLDINENGTHLTIEIPRRWISGDGANSMFMHVYRNGQINFKSDMFTNSIWITDFNLFTGTTIEAANELRRILNGKEWNPKLAAGRRGRTIISFGTTDSELSVEKVSDIIENIRNLITYINIFLHIDSPINIQFLRPVSGGTKTRKIKRKLKKQTKNKKSKVRKSKRVKRKTRKQ